MVMRQIWGRLSVRRYRTPRQVPPNHTARASMHRSASSDYFLFSVLEGFYSSLFSAGPWYRVRDAHLADARILCAGCTAAPVLSHCSYCRSSWATSVQPFHRMRKFARGRRPRGPVLRSADCCDRRFISPVTRRPDCSADSRCGEFQKFVFIDVDS